MTNVEKLLFSKEFLGLEFVFPNKEEVTFEEAQAFCESIGCRLPTLEELNVAYAEGMRFKEYAWSGTVNSTSAYSFYGIDGYGVCDHLNSKGAVRCALLVPSAEKI